MAVGAGQAAATQPGSPILVGQRAPRSGHGRGRGRSRGRGAARRGGRGRVGGAGADVPADQSEGDDAIAESLPSDGRAGADVVADPSEIRDVAISSH